MMNAKRIKLHKTKATAPPNRSSRQTSAHSGNGTHGGQAMSMGDHAAEHQRAEQERLKFSLGIERSNDAIFITALDGTIEYVNPAFERIYGYSKQEAIGKTPRIIKSGLLAPEIYERFWNTLLAKQIVAGEIINKTKDGRLITIEGSANPILDDHGDIIGFLAIQRDVSDRKRAEEALRESEKQYRNLFDNANDILYVHDLAGNFLTINHAAERTTGYSREEAMRMNISQILAPEYLDIAQRALAPAELGTGLTLNEFLIITKDGRRVLLEVSTRLLFSNGKPVAVQGIARDITERNRTQAALRESEERYRELVENLGEAVCYVDALENLTFANPAAHELFGVSPGALIGHNLGEFVDKATFALIRAQTTLRQRGETSTYEHTLIRPDGTQRDVLVTARPRLNKEGKFVGAFSILRDITDRKRAEDTLAKERNLLRTLIDTIPDFIFVKDTESRYLLNNVANLRAMGVSHQNETLGKTAFDFLPPRLAEQFLVDEQAILQTGKPLVDKEEFFTDYADTALRWNLTTKVPLRNTNGAIIGIVGLSRDITDRKRAQEELVLEKIRFQQLFENAPIAIALVDADDRIQSINTAFETIFQYRPDEVIGQFINDLIVPAENLDGALGLSSSVMSGQVTQTETIRRRKDGSLVPVQVYGTPVLRDGKIVAIYAMYADITKRKQAEQALRESEERFRLLVQSQGEGVAIVDAQENFTFANPAAEQTFGVPSGTLIGRNLQEFTDPEHFAKIMAQTEQRREGKHSAYEIEIIRADGEKRNLIITATPQQTNAGKFTGALAVFRDITDRKKMEAELRESEERFRSLVQSQGEGVGITDPAGWFRFANPAAENIFGVPAGQLIGKNLKAFIAPAQIHAIKTQLERPQPGTKITYETVITTTIGKTRNLIVTATPLFNTDGKFSGTLGVFRDITDRKQTEEKLLFASTHDALTGVYNRALFEEELARFEHSRAFPISIIIADVDGLKKVNDSLGHIAGDSLIRRAANLFKSAFRSEDIVARIGGDEFAILLPHTDAAAAALALERIEKILRITNFDHPSVPLRFSLGVATGDKGTRLTDVMMKADHQMYNNKLAKKKSR